MQLFKPECPTAEPPNPDELRRATGSSEIFQAMCIKCDEFHNLHIDLGTLHGLIPREEVAIGVSEGCAREIAILSRVGKPVSFQVLAFDGHGTAILSRRAAQEAARNYYLSTLQPGDIIPAIVQNPASFGVFCDIGCGFPALMRVDRCCISRVQTTATLFTTGQAVFAAVRSVDPVFGQIELTGRELLGTWEENAARFRTGQTVPGIIRSIMPYGIFIELTPNLSGLAEPSFDATIGDPVSVYIRSIQPDKHKIKLNILEKLPVPLPQTPIQYFITAGHLHRWDYYPGSTATTVF